MFHVIDTVTVRDAHFPGILGIAEFFLLFFAAIDVSFYPESAKTHVYTLIFRPYVIRINSLRKTWGGSQVSQPTCPNAPHAVLSTRPLLPAPSSP